MNRYNARLVSVLKKLCQDIENLCELYISERPFLTGGELTIREDNAKRKQLEIVLRQRQLDVMSICNERTDK